MWVRQCDLDAGSDFLPPIPSRIASNEEFVPPPQSAEQKEYEDRLANISEHAAHRQGRSRRDFLRSGSGMAAALLALNQVFGDCYEVSAEEVDDPKAFEERWPKDQFVFDVQTHHVDVSRKWYDDSPTGRGIKAFFRGLRKEAKSEGMLGISPRYVQDKISNALVANSDSTCLNPFMVLNELEEGLKHHSLIHSEEVRERYRQLIAVTKDEYTDVVKNEVQRAIAADEEALMRLCSNYIDNVKAYTQKEKVRNKFTGQPEEPDERLMRSIEEKIDIPDTRKDDFRREIMNYIGALALDGKKFDYKTNERLQKALELKLFEDQKDTIKLTSLVSNVIDKATQEKIDVVKSRLIRNYGYNESSATDVLTFVASIFARGHAKK